MLRTMHPRPVRPALRALLALAVLGSTLAGIVTSAAPARSENLAVVPGADWGPAFPIRAAFYYPWYPSGFYVPGSRYVPTAGEYNVTERSTLTRQVGTMRYAGMNAAIASWWGPYTKEDKRFPALLRSADDTPFKWAAYYEPEGYGNPSPTAIRSHLSYLKDHYGFDKQYLRVRGRPVLFVWTDRADNCDMARRWRQANNMGWYVVLKRFEGMAACPHTRYFDYHQYAPAARISNLGSASSSVSPGYWQYNEPRPRLPRSVWEFDKAVRAMKATRARWQLVTTFNEWGEGTSIESSADWVSASGHGKYADVLHKHLGSR